MGGPKTRQQSKGASAFPDDEMTEETDTLGTGEQGEEILTSGHEASEGEDTGSETIKFRFTKSKGVQPSKRRTANRESATYCLQMMVTLAREMEFNLCHGMHGTRLSSPTLYVNG